MITNRKLRYIEYLRKSTEANERQALSIDAQRNEILKCFPNLNIIDWVQESKSAFEAENRPAFSAMMERIKRGEADGIVAWQPTRLSRNSMDAGQITHYFSHGIIKDLQFVTASFENTPEGVKSLQYALADSQYYSANLSRDVKRGNREKRLKGWLPTANLLGYLNQKNPNPTEEDPTESITAVDPERFPLLQKAWKLFLTGEYSVPAILDVLNNQWGFRTRKTRRKGGCPLSRAGFYKLLKNERYAGIIIEPLTGEKLRGSYPAMISIDEYNRTQELLGRHGKPRLTQKKDFTYKGIARCGECGCSITAEHKRGGKYTYYHCTHKRKDIDCKQGCIEEKDLTRQLEELFDGLTIMKQFEVWGLETIRNMNDEECGDRRHLLDSQSKALKRANEKADRLLDMCAGGLITQEQYKNKLEEVNAEIKQLQKDLNETLENGADWRKMMRKTLEVLFSGREKFENGDAYAKREVLQSLGSNIVIRDKKLSIDTYKWLEPIQKNYKKLEEQFKAGSNSDLQIKNASNESVCQQWRRVGDSNSRCRFPHTSDLANRPLQPLG